MGQKLVVESVYGSAASKVVHLAGKRVDLRAG
jgi:hypothetical protein